MRLCAPVTDEGLIDRRWCRANRVAVAQVAGDRIVDWQEFDVGWNELHDAGTDSEHHARMAEFLRNHAVNAVVVDHMGRCMRSTLDRMEVAIHPGAAGVARAAVEEAARAEAR